MNIIWRFYRDPDQGWKWQRLTADRTVVAESSAAYDDYEGCLANARANGHVFHPSHAKIAPGHVT